MKDSFSAVHPLVNCIYFTMVIVCGMFFMHPLSLSISLMGSIFYGIKLYGKKAVGVRFSYVLMMVLFAVCINICFNHQGQTILWYFPTGNPLTLESIAYALASGVMLLSVMMWFWCHNGVMDSEKIVYLFGRVLPSLSLMLTMILRFLPRCQMQWKAICEAQEMLGRSLRNGGLWQRIQLLAMMISMLVTWSLESAIETADSMKNRGYGLQKRTAFSIYPFDRRDRNLLLFILTLGVWIVFGWCNGAFSFSYYPILQRTPLSVFEIAFQLAYALLCAMPTMLHIREEIRWNTQRMHY